MLTEQNISDYVRGDHLDIPFTITLDQSRTLDGSETWTWVVRWGIGSDTALVTKTLGSGITVDGSFQPKVSIVPADFPLVTFPATQDEYTLVHELEMVKSSRTETVARGTLTVKTGIVD